MVFNRDALAMDCLLALFQQYQYQAYVIGPWGIWMKY